MNAPSELDRAVIEMIGRGTHPPPRSRSVGRRRGPRSVEVRAVFATLDEFEPDGDEIDLAEATRQARAFVASRHPQLGDAALDALAWLFSFEMR